MRPARRLIAVDAQALAPVFGLQGTQRLLLDDARAFRVQAVLVSPQGHCFAEPWLIQALRDLGALTIAFRFDDGMWAALGKRPLRVVQLRHLSGLDPHCHLAATSVRRAVGLLGEVGLPEPVYVPFPVGNRPSPFARAYDGG